MESDTDSDSDYDYLTPSMGITSDMQKIIINSLNPTEDRIKLKDKIIESCTLFESDNSTEVSDSVSYAYERYKKQPNHIHKTDERIRKLQLDGTRYTYYEALTSTQKLEGCVICMSRFQKGIKLTQLRCGDIFHITCYENWNTKSYRCPKCLKTSNDKKAQKEFAALDRRIKNAKRNGYSEIKENEINIRCIDCEIVTEVVQNPIKNKCSICGSYNTSIEDED